MEQQKEKENAIIKETIKELVQRMGFTCEVEAEEAKTDDILAQTFNIKAEESSFLIGQHGVNLQSLQHITRILVRKKIPIKSKFILDVNSYRKEKNASLVKFAHSMAEQAVREKRDIVLRPMSPYERRIVHLELSGNHQIKTESIGEGEERKVVISPVNLF
jgi:spoIIIJ-associated protein